MQGQDPNIWIQLYESTPTVLRWLLSILTLGILTAYHYIWRRQQQRLAAIEQRERSYATSEDVKEVNARVGVVHEDVKKIMFHLMKKEN